MMLAGDDHGELESVAPPSSNHLESGAHFRPAREVNDGNIDSLSIGNSDGLPAVGGDMQGESVNGFKECNKSATDIPVFFQQKNVSPTLWHLDK